MQSCEVKASSVWRKIITLVWCRSLDQLLVQYTDWGNWVKDYKASLDLRGLGGVALPHMNAWWLSHHSGHLLSCWLISFHWPTISTVSKSLAGLLLLSEITALCETWQNQISLTWIQRETREVVRWNEGKMEIEKRQIAKIFWMLMRKNDRDMRI